MLQLYTALHSLNCGTRRRVIRSDDSFRNNPFAEGCDDLMQLKSHQTHYDDFLSITLQTHQSLKMLKQCYAKGEN
jgi:hypothetical protein